MNGSSWPAIGAGIVAAATPLLLAATGELITERAGLLNLGVEGMMAVGAVSAFGVSSWSGNAYLGVVAGMAAGMVCGLLFAWLVVGLLADQVATGLALTLFGHGVSGVLGHPFAGQSINSLPVWHWPGLDAIPGFGSVLFNHTFPVYLALILPFIVHRFLFSSRIGLVVRAVGEDPEKAWALGLPVVLTRYLAAAFGGLMAGLGGAFLSTAYTPMWAQGMISGQGWIAIGLVVFATWRPLRVLLGAFIFAAVSVGQLFSQAIGWQFNTYFLSALPYLTVIVALVVISRDNLRIRLNTPAALGQTFKPET